jgi:phosphatidylserine decarboxylase
MIAREGIPFTLVGVVLTVVVFLLAARWSNWWLFGVSAALALLTLFATYFFRDPDRAIPPGNESLIVAPADGKVIGIDTVSDVSYVGERAIKVSIFLSVLDVHVNRVPISGRVEKFEYKKGEFHAAFMDKASGLNEQTVIRIRSRLGAGVIVKQIAGVLARRIVCRLEEGQQVAAGERFGLIRFGSRTELFLPVDTRLSVEMGDHVAGGSSVIGYLADRSSSAGEDAEQKEVSAARGDDVKL